MGVGVGGRRRLGRRGCGGGNEDVTGGGSDGRGGKNCCCMGGGRRSRCGVASSGDIAAMAIRGNGNGGGGGVRGGCGCCGARRGGEGGSGVRGDARLVAAAWAGAAAAAAAAEPLASRRRARCAGRRPLFGSSSACASASMAAAAAALSAAPFKGSTACLHAVQIRPSRPPIQRGPARRRPAGGARLAVAAFAAAAGPRSFETVRRAVLGANGNRCGTTLDGMMGSTRPTRWTNDGILRGRDGVSALLDHTCACEVLRPWTWLGYKKNRDVAL